MSGVWVFKNGVAKLVPNPMEESLEGDDMVRATALRPKELVFNPTEEVINDYELLEEKLLALGWEVYDTDDESVRQYHKSHTPHLITLPADFNDIKPMHMYDIVVKCRSYFEVRDADES